MPVQTTRTSSIFFPDGAKVSIKPAGEGSYYDVGAISTAVTATLNWEENQIETANAGKTAKQVRSMTISGGFTLVNLDPTGVEKLGAGIFTKTTTTDSPTSNIDDQIIAASWTDKAIVNLSLIDTTTDDEYKASTEPTLTVTASVTGLLTADDDYYIIPDDNSPSGYSIILNTSGGSGVATSEEITIAYSSVTPIASTIIYAGESTFTLSAYAMRITHTDDAGKIRQLDLYSVDPNTGGFQFNYKGANEDGLEEMPLTYTAKLDTSRTSGQQLLAWTIESGAE